MKKKVVFRADAGKSIGFGHFVRSLALANYLSDHFECFFLSYNPNNLGMSEYQINEILKICTPIQFFYKDQKEYDAQFLDALCGTEIVVLDNYYFDTDYQQEIIKKGCKLVCIDDLAGKEFVAHAVITSAPLGRSDFQIPKDSLFLGGTKFTLLREPFIKPAYRNLPSKISNIVLAMGGADPYGLTDRILSLLKKLSPTIQIELILGDTVNIQNKTIKEINIHRRLSAEEIVNIFDRVDLGIFPASTICGEAFACHLPVAGGWYVDNQKSFYDFCVEKKWFFPLGNFLSSEEKLLEKLRESLDINNLITPPNIPYDEGRYEIIKLFQSL